MRAVLTSILCLFLIFALCACSDVPEETQNTSPSPIEQSEPAQNTQPIPTEQESLNIPEIPPQDQLISADPKTAEDWVFTNYEQELYWRDPDNQYHTMKIVLPALTPAADFAVEYNRSVSELGQLLLNDVLNSYEKGYYPSTVGLTYTVSSWDDILFIVMERRMAEGYSIYYVNAFDLEEREALYAGDVSDELVKMDYPTFILAVTELVKQDYIRTYGPEIKELEENTYTGTDSFFATEPNEKVENYYKTLERLPYLTLYLSQARLFADDDGNLLLYCLTPVLDGLDAAAKVISFDISALGWKNMPTEEQAYGYLFDIQYYTDGIHADAYSLMLTEAFFSDPEEFVEHAAVEGKESISLIIDMLKYNLYGNQIDEFTRECNELIRENDLTEKERAFINAALEVIK